MINKAEKRYYNIVIFFLFITFFSELINLIVPLSIQPATIILNLLCFIMVAILLILVLKKKEIKVDRFSILFLLFFCVYIVSFLYSGESTYNKLMAIRGTIGYMFLCVFIYKLITNTNFIDKLLIFIYRLGVFFGLFGIMQFLFRNVLPYELLEPKNYPAPNHFYETDIIRVNGMLGNMIIYGSIMLLFYSIFINKFFNEFKVRNLIGSIVAFTAIIFTFSRAAFVGAVLFTVISILIFLYRKRNFVTFSFMSFSLVVSIFIFLFNWDTIQNSFLFSSVLSSDNQNVQWSNATHFTLIEESFALFKESPIFGFGIATQNLDSIFSKSHIYVTDGAFFSKLLETGIIGITINSLIILFVFYITIKAMKIYKYRYLTTGFLLFSVYNFFFASILNSAYYGRVMFILYWAIFGIILSIYRSYTKNNSKSNNKIEYTGNSKVG